MNLAQELTDQIRSYIDHQSTLAELRAWLGSSVPAIDASADAYVRSISDRLWMLLAETDYGHRDEGSLRATLVSLLALPDIKEYRVWTWGQATAPNVRTEANRQTESYSSFPVRFTEPGSGVRWSADIRPVTASS